MPPREAISASTASALDQASLRTVAWSTVYSAITASNCQTGGCHDGAHITGLDLSDSAAAKADLNNNVNCGSLGSCPTEERSLDYDLAGSAFHQKLDLDTGNQCGSEMSGFVTGWTTSDRDFVRQWICSGTP